jgi:hypothetical protein
VSRRPRIVPYEHRRQPLLPRNAFLRRLAGHGALSFLLVSGSLSLGVMGYHYIEGLPWIDALLNAAMILGGEGPVDRLHTIAGKAFASVYALFSGMVFLAAASILIAPLAHRLLHRLHLEEDDGDESPSAR